MADERLKVWEILFERALVLIDDARASGIPVDGWTFGGGTVLLEIVLDTLARASSLKALP